MPDKDDKYTSENIKTNKDLSACRNALAKESSELSFALSKKQTELKAFSEKVTKKLETNPGSHKSTLDPTKKEGIWELTAPSNLVAMRQEWDNHMQTCDLLEKSIKEQTARLSNLDMLIGSFTEDTVLTTEDKQIFINEANRCANAIAEFKKIYENTWSESQLKEQRKQKETQREQRKLKEAKHKTQGAALSKLEIADNANETLKAVGKTSETKEKKATGHHKPKQKVITDEQEIIALAFRMFDQHKVKSKSAEAKTKRTDIVMLIELQEKLGLYIYEKSMSTNNPSNIKKANAIIKYLEKNPSETITPELMLCIADNTPAAKGGLKKIIDDFTHEAIAKGHALPEQSHHQPKK